jgi:hypothetical protein
MPSPDRPRAEIRSCPIQDRQVSPQQLHNRYTSKLKCVANKLATSDTELTGSNGATTTCAMHCTAAAGTLRRR